MIEWKPNNIFYTGEEMGKFVERVVKEAVGRDGKTIAEYEERRKFDAGLGIDQLFVLHQRNGKQAFLNMDEEKVFFEHGYGFLPTEHPKFVKFTGSKNMFEFGNVVTGDVLFREKTNIKVEGEFAHMGNEDGSKSIGHIFSGREIRQVESVFNPSENKNVAIVSKTDVEQTQSLVSRKTGRELISRVYQIEIDAEFPDWAYVTKLDFNGGPGDRDRINFAELEKQLEEADQKIKLNALHNVKEQSEIAMDALLDLRRGVKKARALNPEKMKEFKREAKAMIDEA